MIVIQLTLIITHSPYLLPIALVSIRLLSETVSPAQGKDCWTCTLISLQRKSGRRVMVRYQVQKS